MTHGTREQLRVLRRAANGVPLTIAEKEELSLLVAALTDRATLGVSDATTVTERLHRDYHWLNLPELPSAAVKKMRYMLAYSAGRSLVAMHWTSGLLTHGCGFTERVLASLRLNDWARTGMSRRDGLSYQFTLHVAATGEVCPVYRQVTPCTGSLVPSTKDGSPSTLRAMPTEPASSRSPSLNVWAVMRHRFPQLFSPKTGSVQPRSEPNIPQCACLARASAMESQHTSLDAIDVLWYGSTPMTPVAALQLACGEGSNY